jgi:hypothetical protein
MTSNTKHCPDGLLPDGEVCPRCGGRRGPSGIGGGTWVHYPTENEKVAQLIQAIKNIAVNQGKTDEQVMDEISEHFGLNKERVFEFTIKIVGQGTTEEEAWEDTKEFLLKKIEDAGYDEAKDITAE